MRGLALLALLAGCGGGEGNRADDTDTRGETGAPDTGDTPAGTATLSGTVVDAQGSPLQVVGNVRVQYCRGTVCLTPTSAEDNVFSFERLDPGPGSFEIVPIADNARYATPFSVVSVSDGEQRDLGALVVPILDAAVPLPVVAAELEVVEGLHLTLGTASLSKPSPLDEDATEVAGVNATDVTFPIEGPTGEVLAVWYLSPFDYDATDEAGIPIRVDDAWSVGSGNAELWVGDYFTATWNKVGDLVDDGAGKLSPGAGLERLSTVVVVRKP